MKITEKKYYKVLFWITAAMMGFLAYRANKLKKELEKCSAGRAAE